jgi:hypothetical protein
MTVFHFRDLLVCGTSRGNAVRLVFHAKPQLLKFFDSTEYAAAVFTRELSITLASFACLQFHLGTRLSVLLPSGGKPEVSQIGVVCYSSGDDFLASGEPQLNTKEILDHINGEISRLQQVKALLQGSTNGHARSASAPSLNGTAAPKVKGRRVLSAEARKKIAAAQRKRWANVRKAQA